MLRNALETEGKALELIIHRKLLEYYGGMENVKGECKVTFTKVVAEEVKKMWEKDLSLMPS